MNRSDQKKIRLTNNSFTKASLKLEPSHERLHFYTPHAELLWDSFSIFHDNRS